MDPDQHTPPAKAHPLVTALGVDGLRSLASARLDLNPSLTVIHGPNGAGKSSLLEAVCLALTGRSPRSVTAGTIGDYLVPYASALGRPRHGEEMFPGAETLHVPLADHFDLLNHDDIYAALRGWLKVASRGFRVLGVVGILYGAWDAITSIVSPPAACSGTLTGC